MNKKGYGKMLAGVGIGLGLGLLFAPEKVLRLERC